MSTLTLILSIWAGIGPLVGILLGAHLARSFQRRQWIANEKVKEWRELLGTLTTSLTMMVRMFDAAEYLRANIAAGEVLSNRLFIAEEVRRRQLHDRWIAAVAAFEKDHDPAAFGTEFGRISAQIQQGANADINKV